jgi:hypothetical protein
VIPLFNFVTVVSKQCSSVDCKLFRTKLHIWFCTQDVLVWILPCFVCVCEWVSGSSMNATRNNFDCHFLHRSYCFLNVTIWYAYNGPTYIPEINNEHFLIYRALIILLTNLKLYIPCMIKILFTYISTMLHITILIDWKCQTLHMFRLCLSHLQGLLL